MSIEAESHGQVKQLRKQHPNEVIIVVEEKRRTIYRPGKGARPMIMPPNGVPAPRVRRP
jgi:hypothetical protein